jgi:hypothetical protein
MFLKLNPHLPLSSTLELRDLILMIIPFINIIRKYLMKVHMNFIPNKSCYNSLSRQLQLVIATPFTIKLNGIKYLWYKAKKMLGPCKLLQSPMGHPLSTKVHTNFADKWQSLCLYSSQKPWSLIFPSQ